MTKITLQKLQEADGAALIAANLASRPLHHPWAEPCTDQAGFDAWFARMSGPTSLSLIMREGVTGQIAGVINLSQIVYGNFCSAYLGFYAMAGHEGRGLMTEALRQAAGHAFTSLRLHRLEANIQPGNLKSLALVRRAGFQREGFSPRYLQIAGAWRDHERWALLAD